MAQEVSEYSPKRYTDARLGRVLQGNRHQHCHSTDVNGKDAMFDSFDFPITYSFEHISITQHFTMQVHWCIFYLLQL